MLKRLLILIFLLAVAAATAYFFFRKRIIRSIVPVIEEVYINDLVIENGIGKAHLILYLENKDLINYYVKSMNLSLTHSSLELLNYQRDSVYTLMAGERKQFDLEFDVDTDQLMKRIKSLQHKDSTSVNITGDILFETFIGDYNITIDKSVKIKVPNPPDIRIREVEYLGVRNVDSIDFNIHIGVLNYNPNILGIRDVKYFFKSDEYFEVNGILPDVMLDTSDTVVRIIPITVVTKRKMELLSKIILNRDEIEYNLVIEGILLLQNEKQKELNVRLSKKDKFEVVRKNKKERIKFTNQRKKERKAKREEKRSNHQ